MIDKLKSNYEFLKKLDETLFRRENAKYFLMIKRGEYKLFRKSEFFTKRFQILA